MFVCARRTSRKDEERVTKNGGGGDASWNLPWDAGVEVTEERKEERKISFPLKKKKKKRKLGGKRSVCSTKKFFWGRGGGRRGWTERCRSSFKRRKLFFSLFLSSCLKSMHHNFPRETNL